MDGTSQHSTDTLELEGTRTSSESMTPLVHSPDGESGNPRPQRVLLVDDHATARSLLRILLEEHPEFVVVGEASDGEEAIALADLYRPDIVLMDIHLPRLNGVEATRRLHQLWPRTAIVGVSSQYTPYGYNAMIAAGAVAFVCKEDAVGALYKTIEFSMRAYRSHPPQPAAPLPSREVPAEDLQRSLSDLPLPLD